MKVCFNSTVQMYSLWNNCANRLGNLSIANISYFNIGNISLKEDVNIFIGETIEMKRPGEVVKLWYMAPNSFIYCTALHRDTLCSRYATAVRLNKKDYFKISCSHFPLNISFYFQQPELGTRQHCRDTVTMISVHKMIDYWTSSILVAATPVGHQDLNIFRIFYVTEALLLLLSRS